MSGQLTKSRADGSLGVVPDCRRILLRFTPHTLVSRDTSVHFPEVSRPLVVRGARLAWRDGDGARVLCGQLHDVQLPQGAASEPNEQRHRGGALARAPP